MYTDAVRRFGTRVTRCTGKGTPTVAGHRGPGRWHRPRERPQWSCSDNVVTPHAYRRHRGEQHGSTNDTHQRRNRAAGRSSDVALSGMHHHRASPAPTRTSAGLLHELLQTTRLPLASTPPPRDQLSDTPGTRTHLRPHTRRPLRRRLHLATPHSVSLWSTSPPHRLRHLRGRRPRSHPTYGPHQVLRSRHRPRPSSRRRHDLSIMRRPPRSPRRTACRHPRPAQTR